MHFVLLISKLSATSIKHVTDVLVEMIALRLYVVVERNSSRTVDGVEVEMCFWCWSRDASGLSHTCLSSLFSGWCISNSYLFTKSLLKSFTKYPRIPVHYINTNSNVLIMCRFLSEDLSNSVNMISVNNPASFFAYTLNWTINYSIKKYQ